MRKQYYFFIFLVGSVHYLWSMDSEDLSLAKSYVHVYAESDPRRVEIKSASGNQLLSIRCPRSMNPEDLRIVFMLKIEDGSDSGYAISPVYPFVSTTVLSKIQGCQVDWSRSQVSVWPAQGVQELMTVNKVETVDKVEMAKSISKHSMWASLSDGALKIFEPDWELVQHPQHRDTEDAHRRLELVRVLSRGVYRHRR